MRFVLAPLLSFDNVAEIRRELPAHPLMQAPGLPMGSHGLLVSGAGEESVRLSAGHAQMDPISLLHRVDTVREGDRLFDLDTVHRAHFRPTAGGRCSTW